jgi:hypothetical protein
MGAFDPCSQLSRHPRNSLTESAAAAQRAFRVVTKHYGLRVAER